MLILVNLVLPLVKSSSKRKPAPNSSYEVVAFFQQTPIVLHTGLHHSYFYIVDKCTGGRLIAFEAERMVHSISKYASGTIRVIRNTKKTVESMSGNCMKAAARKLSQGLSERFIPSYIFPLLHSFAHRFSILPKAQKDLAGCEILS